MQTTNFKLSLLYKAFLIILLCIGVLLMLITLGNEDWQFLSTYKFTPIQIILLLIAQVTLLLASSYSWKATFLSATQKPLPLKAAVEQTGFLLIGKYIPGKVWGIGLRMLTSSRYNLKQSEIISASSLEIVVMQYASFSTGVALTCTYFSPIYSLGVLFLAIICFSPAMIILKKLLHHLQSRVGREPPTPIDGSSDLIVLIFNFIVWLIACGIYAIIISTASPEYSVSVTIFLCGAYILATTCGFLAVFTPGGIGVREGVFIALASLAINNEQAIAISLLLRAWNCFYDLFASTCSLLVFKYAPHINPNIRPNNQ